VATDTARTTEKSYWGKTREGETKQVKFAGASINYKAKPALSNVSC